MMLSFRDKWLSHFSDLNVSSSFMQTYNRGNTASLAVVMGEEKKRNNLLANLLRNSLQ